MARGVRLTNSGADATADLSVQEPKHKADDATKEHGREEKQPDGRYPLDGQKDYAGYGHQPHRMARQQTYPGETERLNVADAQFGPGGPEPACAPKFRSVRTPLLYVGEREHRHCQSVWFFRSEAVARLDTRTPRTHEAHSSSED